MSYNQNLIAHFEARCDAEDRRYESGRIAHLARRRDADRSLARFERTLTGKGC